MNAYAAAARSDLDALLALNDDYIRSVQDGDARRFGEILAEDFLCSNPDGSLVDKAGFLAQTARPVTIRGLSTEDVKVRVLGDAAIIHARTSYTTAEGAPNGARFLFLLDGADIARLDRFDRVLDLFDGNDEAALEAARRRWAAAKAAGHALS